MGVIGDWNMHTCESAGSVKEGQKISLRMTSAVSNRRRHPRYRMWRLFACLRVGHLDAVVGYGKARR